jgi:MFS family permease
VLDFLPALLVDLAAYLVMFTLQQMLADRVGRGPEAALPLALFSNAYTVAYVLGTIGLGRHSDRPGLRRPFMLVGLLVTALVPLAFTSQGLATWSFYAGIAVFGLGSALYWPAQQARIGDRESPEALPGALRRFNLGWTLGKALGLLVGGSLYELGRKLEHGPSLALIAAFAALLLALGLQALDRAPGVAHGAEVNLSHKARKRGFLFASLGANFALWGAATLVIALIPVLGEQLGIDVEKQGWVNSGLVLAQSFVFLVLGQSQKWTYRASFILAILGLGGLAGLGLFFAPNVYLAVPLILATGALGGAAYACAIFYSLDYDARRGLRMSIHEAVLGAGGLLVPLAGSAVATLTHVARAPYAISGTICLVLLFLASVWLRSGSE